jgi:hypothetical protein
MDNPGTRFLWDARAGPGSHGGLRLGMLGGKLLCQTRNFCYR